MAEVIPVSEPEDAWDWSVDQVVSELCRSPHDRPKWCSQTDHLPDPKLLENELRGNDVTGEVLLAAISKDVLRGDLNIKSMGQRHAVEKAINFLRSRSQKYLAAFPSTAMMSPFTPVGSWLRNSGPPYENPSNKVVSVKSLVPTALPENSAQADVKFEMPESPHNYAQAAAVTPHHHATYFSPNAIEQDSNAVQAPAISALPAGSGDIPATAAEIGPRTKIPRRIAPTFVAHLDQNRMLQSSTAGEEGSGLDYRPDDHDETSRREFTLSRAFVVDWRRFGVSRKLRKQLRPEIRAQAGHVEKPQGSAGIMNQEEPLSIEGTQKKISEGSILGDDGDADYRYLLAKYPPKDEVEDVLDLYGESGEEGNFDDETWLEIEKDAAEDSYHEHSSRALAPHDMERIIDDAVDTMKKGWRGSKLARVQAKGFRLWNKANRQARVDIELSHARYWLGHLENSLAKIRQAILRDTWTSESGLRHQCQSFEESIHQQLEHQYNISILTSSVTPPRPDSKSIQRRERSPVDLPEGEILIDSESDISIGEFIDNDEPELRNAAIQHDPPIPSSSSPTLIDTGKVASPSPERQESRPQIRLVHPRKNPFIEAESSTSPAESESVPPATPPSSRFDRMGHEMSMPIELSSSDPATPGRPNTDDRPSTQRWESKELHSPTPQRLRLRLRQPKLPATTFSSSLIETDGLSNMAWEVASDETERCYALSEAVGLLSTSKIDEILRFLSMCPREGFRRALNMGFKAILNRFAKVKGLADEYADAAKMTALLFTSYLFAKKVVKKRDLDQQMSKQARFLLGAEWHSFFAALRVTLNTHQSGRASRPGKRKLSHADSREDTDSSLPPRSATSQQASGKKRRRRVKDCLLPTSSQQQGHQRVEEDAQRRAILDQKFRNLPRNMRNPGTHSINAQEPVIYLDPKIGEKVKDHQIDGIRFLWRELTTDENGQGCLLAHTMGLGKTMQVISTLVTIAQSAESPDPRVREQIPADLRNVTALILCPPSLIDNWSEEIMMWRPKPADVGHVYTITQRLRLRDRIEEINQWAQTGGILVISYEMFRGLIVNKAPRRSIAEKPLNQTDHARIEEQLLRRPNIIIADEAHKMKNTKANISMATSRFKSSRRIALTGSPLANNLEEYFAMIDWVAPGYLGTRDQFKIKYADPIVDGLWNDSDVYDRRTSLRKLHVLKKNLDPKISRADITAIADDLPPKTEFFITVPLTPKQAKAYNLFTNTLIGENGGQSTGNTRLWDWLAILTLLCNHPSTFLTKLDDRQYSYANKKRRLKKGKVNSPDGTLDDAEVIELPADVEVANVGLAPGLIEKQRKIYEADEESERLEDPTLSHRAHIACQIVKYAMDAGDKVLLFSHSIPTLNYLQIAFESSDCSVCRMDGSTNVTKRQDSVKEFNKDTSGYNVFIISTKAGGLGLNLQGANRVILFDYGFNPVWEEQAIGRAYRLGQQKPVFVYRLRAGGTFEELIYNKAVFKSQLSARVVDKKFPMRYASKKATDYLFDVKEVSQTDLSPFVGKDPLVLDRILANVKYIRDIVLTETFQKEEVESLTPEEALQALNELKDAQAERKKQVISNRPLPRQRMVTANNRPPTIENPGQRSARTSTPNGPSTAPRNGAKEVFAAFQSRSSQDTMGIDPAMSISRPEATGGGQQLESDILGQNSTIPHRSRLTNVLGVNSPPKTALHSHIPLSSAVRSQTDVQGHSYGHSPYRSPKTRITQLDGASDRIDNKNTKLDENSDIESCKTQ